MAERFASVAWSDHYVSCSAFGKIIMEQLCETAVRISFSEVQLWDIMTERNVYTPKNSDVNGDSSSISSSFTYRPREGCERPRGRVGYHAQEFLCYQYFQPQ